MNTKLINDKIILDYWKNKISLIQNSIEDNHYDTFEKRSYTIAITPYVSKKISDLCSNSYPLIYNFYLTALYILIYRYQKQQKICITSSPLHFIESDIDFHSPLFLYCKLEQNETFNSLYKKIKIDVLEAHKHQGISSDNIRNLTKGSSSGFNDIAFNFKYQDNTFYKFNIDPKLLFEVDHNSILTEINLSVSTSYFSNSQDNLLLNYKNILDEIIIDTDKFINNLSVINEIEQHTLINAFGEGKITNLTHNSLYSYFDKQCKQIPNKVAVVNEDQSITFKMLQYRVDKLCDFILSNYPLSEYHTIILFASRSIEMIVASLALIKAGRTYVPLDPSLPKERIIYIIKDTKAKLVILEPEHIDMFDDIQWEIDGFKSYVCLTVPKDQDYNFVADDSAVKTVMNNYVETEGTNDATESGWVSSYTGLEFSNQELRDLVENVKIKLFDYLHPNARVLEIGCGSGLILFDIAPVVAEYHAVDISDVIVKKVQNKVNQSKLRNVKLYTMSAVEINNILLEKESYDIIIINSAMTHFPSYQYLRRFLSLGVDLLKENGIFFIGDVRDKAKQLEFYESLINFKMQNNGTQFFKNEEPQSHSRNVNYYKHLYQSKENLEQTLLDAKRNEPHFFISKEFFVDYFSNSFPNSDVKISGKLGKVDNELKLYRYDVIVNVKKSSQKSNFIINTGKSQIFDYSLFTSQHIKNYVASSSANIILYTSGSTGSPKGVLIQEKNLISLTENEANDLNDKQDNCWLLMQAISFDVSLWEIFGSILNGAKLVIVPTATFLNSDEFGLLLLNERVTVMTQVPSMFKTLLPGILKLKENSQLSYLVLGGEILKSSIIQQLRDKMPSLQIINAYGMTECSVISAWHWINNTENNPAITLGKPISNTEILIVDDFDQLVPIGCYGEICISGQGVAERYLNSPELTQKKFKTNPFNNKPLYKTGDIGRWLANGYLEYRERRDFQLKIRGYRVEMAEIEQALLLHPQINDVVVNANHTIADGALCAYYVLNKPFLDIDKQDVHIEQNNLTISKTQEVLLDELNNTYREINGSKLFIDYFKEVVDKMGNRIAMQCGDHLITYAKLNNEVAKLAGHLTTQHKIQSQEIVAVILDRSVEFFKTVLAIWQCGASYIPIDPQYPFERIETILQESNAQFIISKSAYSAKIIFSKASNLIYLDGIEEINFTDKSNCSSAKSGNDLAYIMFTSGSTGKPKGVMIEQKGMINHFLSKVSEMNITKESVIAQNASQCFDISIWQAFSAFISGGKTVIYDDDTLMNVENFISKIDRDNVTILETVPTYLSEMLDSIQLHNSERIFKSLKILISNAETLKPIIVEKWFKLFSHITLVNTYGATEASDDTSHYFMSKMPDAPSIPICFKPIQNFKYYVLNKQMERCPFGVDGEIYLSSQYIGRGYINNVEKTHESFLLDPFNKYPVKMYKTGDFGRYLNDGRLEFTGREDQQIKLNGYRIELAEIENIIAQLPEIKDAVVLNFHTAEDKSYLHCFITFNQNETLSENQITQILKNKLLWYMMPSVYTFLTSFPINDNGKVNRGLLRLEYEAQFEDKMAEVLRKHLLLTLQPHMIPNYFIALKSIPVNSHGKVDRSALSQPLQIKARKSDVKNSYDPNEKLLTDLWKLVLGDKIISIDENFFELGGHSLKAAKLVAHIQKKFNINIELAFVFINPTIRKQLTAIKENSASESTEITVLPTKNAYEVSLAQKRILLTYLSSDASVVYNMIAAYALKGKINEQKIENAFLKLIERHEILRTTFVLDDIEFFQKIHDLQSIKYKLETIDWSNNIDYEADLKIFLDVERKKKFNLEEGPLLRATLIKLNTASFILIFSIHHIVADGWSGQILISDLTSLYVNENQEEKILLQPLKIHYKDYAAWHNKMMINNLSDSLIGYWKEKLGGFKPLKLKYDFQQPSMKTYNSKSLHSAIQGDVYFKLMELCNKSNVSVFSLLQTVTKIVLFVQSHQEDISVLVPMSGRNHVDLEGQVGFYLNPVIIRNQIDKEYNFSYLLKQVNSTFVEAVNFQEYPFDLLSDQLDIFKDENIHSVFNVCIDFHDFSGLVNEDQGITDIDIKAIPLEEVNGGKYGLDFLLTRGSNGVDLTLWYNTDLFQDATIYRLVYFFNGIINEVTVDPDIQIEGMIEKLDKKYKASLEKEKSTFKSGRFDKLFNHSKA